MKLYLFELSMLFVVIAGEECKNYSKWCHYMTTRGACTIDKRTQELCPRTCRKCSVTCTFIESSKRKECGYVGITQEECWHAGCCWGPIGINSKYPWCYKSPTNI